MFGGWECLPRDLLLMVSENLSSVSDYLQFSVVCKQWYLAAKENYRRLVGSKLCSKIPLLLIPTHDNNVERRGLYNITDDKIFDFELSVPYKRRFCGSSHGWLIAMEEDRSVALINPFTGRVIQIPPVIKPEDDIGIPCYYGDNSPVQVVMWNYCDIEYEIFKITLSANPDLCPDGYIVMATYGVYQTIAYFRSGDQYWTRIDHQDMKFIHFTDLFYHNGRIYASDHWGRVISVDISSDNHGEVNIIVPKNTGIKKYCERVYLVFSFIGELILVQRFIELMENEDEDFLQHITKVVKVFKLIDGKKVEVNSLDNNILFLGDSHSICVSGFGSRCPPELRPNCIYYTDDFNDYGHRPPLGFRDIGFFDVQNKSFGTHYILDPSHKDMPPAIWIVPTVHWNVAQFQPDDNLF